MTFRNSNPICRRNSIGILKKQERENLGYLNAKETFFIPGKVTEQIPQTNSNPFRYLHLKVLLYRPIFHQFCAQSQRSHLMNQLSGQKSFDKTMIYSIIQSYATACIESAQQLITFINTSSRTRAAGAWWYAIFCEYSPGIVILRLII